MGHSVIADQVNTTCLCGLPGCGISPASMFVPGEQGECVGLTISDAATLQMRAMVIAQICTLNQHLNPPLIITLTEPGVEPPSYPVLEAALMTPPPTVHNGASGAVTTQTHSKHPRDNWTQQIYGIPRGKICPWCGDTFKWGSSRIRHIRAVHKGGRNCPHCKIPYQTQRQITLHLGVRQERGRCYREVTTVLEDSDTSTVGASSSGMRELSLSD